MRLFKSLAIATLALAAFGTANAVPIVEAYSGEVGVLGGGQFVGEGDSFFFRFDMINPGPNATNSNLRFVRDGVGAEGGWQAARLRMAFFSIDRVPEIARIVLATVDDNGVLIENLGNFVISASGPDPVFWLNYSFTAAQRAAWTNTGTGAVRIRADFLLGGRQNDFEIQRVSLAVLVPEPGTLLLLSLG